ncbi:hypothetical protein AAFF_G00218290 [Aldrovandia affinis]|uniref:Uncharacterized protein n=1 Tax=Aldrovandia affinis TaxID=143900 RepID=A0AAD7WUT0_9TELE|nr:hypothetical protein AAFF_G00218290 [Aldrovandia affinis]
MGLRGDLSSLLWLRGERKQERQPDPRGNPDISATKTCPEPRALSRSPGAPALVICLPQIYLMSTVGKAGHRHGSEKKKTAAGDSLGVLGPSVEQGTSGPVQTPNDASPAHTSSHA